MRQYTSHLSVRSRHLDISRSNHSSVHFDFKAGIGQSSQIQLLLLLLEVLVSR
jgi:hypothetical protein